MRAAQTAVLGLGEHRVSPNFRDDVWERIHAGEASPEILLQEPVSPATKFRYGLLGAAAAAVFLVALNLMDPTSPGDPLDPTEVAELDSVKTPLTPATLADHTLEELSAAQQGLRRRDPANSRSMRQDIEVLRGGLTFLHGLENRRFLQLTGEDDCVRSAMSIAQKMSEQGSDWSREEVDALREALEDCPVDSVRFMFPRQAMEQEFRQFLQDNPHLIPFFQGMRNPVIIPNFGAIPSTRRVQIMIVHKDRREGR